MTEVSDSFAMFFKTALNCPPVHACVVAVGEEGEVRKVSPATLALRPLPPHRHVQVVLEDMGRFEANFIRVWWSLAPKETTV